MKTIDWLMKGDPSIQRLVTKYLLDKEPSYREDGIIERYLKLFDKETGLWGNGVYSPKWISTHYTLLELKYMEIAPSNQFYHRGLNHLIDNEWRTTAMDTYHPGQDICVLAMIVGLCVYGRFKDKRIDEMVDYILEHQMSDGGWNCSWDSMRHPAKKSSLHTTLTVLEALGEYLKYDYTYQKEKLRAVISQGEEFILKKSLFRSVRTGEIINPDFVKFHYPARWKYDAFRALEYFQSVNHSYDERMQEALDLIIKKIQKGYLTKGQQYAGKIHFPLEDTKAGRFNTYRALKILKYYVPDFYYKIINLDFIID